MNMRMTYAEIPADSVVYDTQTGLFPFSSRKEVDKDHVCRIAQSIEETGYWSPILLRAKTMQGLAGNHRFLALLYLAEKSRTPLETLKVPALLVECDEEEAVAIGLLENEMRKQITQWELVKAILRVSSKRGGAVERLYRLDGKTVEQLRFWPDGLDHKAEEEAIKRIARTRLPSEWWRVIQEQLTDHDQLRATLQERLRDPSWVIGRTLEDLNEEITLELRASGIRFETGKTWNPVPTARCLGNQTSFGEVIRALSDDPDRPVPTLDGRWPGACRYLRLFPTYIQHLAPLPERECCARTSGHQLAPMAEGSGNSDAERHSSAEGTRLLEEIEAYCVDPRWQRADSCFGELEGLAADEAVSTFRDAGLPAVLHGRVGELEAAGQFVWRRPDISGAECTPSSCPFGGDDPPGIVMPIYPHGPGDPVCLNAMCGMPAREEGGNRETDARQTDPGGLQEALDKLRRMSIQRTLFSPPGNGVLLTDPLVLAALEEVLVPKWDVKTMLHIATGCLLAGDVGEMNDRETDGFPRSPAGPETPLSPSALREHAPDHEVREEFKSVRDRYVKTAQDLERWIACLVLVRTWRDCTDTLEGAKSALERLAWISASTDTVGG
jgi:hypothetical protein